MPSLLPVLAGHGRGRFEVQGLSTLEKRVGGSALLPISLALPWLHTAPPGKKSGLLLFSFFLGLYLHAYDRFTVILSVYD